MQVRRIPGVAQPPLAVGAWLRFDAINDAIRAAQPTSIVEVGPGQGALGGWLAQQFDYTGVERDDTSRQAVSARLEAVGSGRVVGDVSDVVAACDLVCAFEVLEHIDDDATALKQWTQLLPIGGHLALSVPAHARRFGPWDRLAGHYRRYDRAELVAVAHQAGLEVVWIQATGAIGGQCLEVIRNQVARMKGFGGTAPLSPTELAASTANSGRVFQADAGVRALTLRFIAYPLRLLQRQFRRTSVGVGWVLFAKRAS